MSDPLALLPLAVAAGGGRLDAGEAAALVAAGVTLLQRSAPLVRALSGARAAILLPSGPAFLTALAASDGRGALLLDPHGAPDDIAWQLADAGVGAVFTLHHLATRLPADMPVALLDDAPRTARVIVPGRTMDVDLGSHHGLALEGNTASDGRDEEYVVVYADVPREGGLPRPRLALSHRDLLADARAAIAELLLTPVDHTHVALPISNPLALTLGLTAPLLAGGSVTMRPDARGDDVLRALEANTITVLVTVAAVYQDVLSQHAARGGAWRATSLVTCLCGGAPIDPALATRWQDATATRVIWYGGAEDVATWRDVHLPRPRSD
jgi:acyl-CoA synthetase (AMP-forming)/AMP-acid ligase II